MKRISKENPFFDEVREYIEICSEKGNKPITECHKTIKVYKEEKNIEYRILAERFNTYKDKYKLEDIRTDHGDCNSKHSSAERIECRKSFRTGNCKSIRFSSCCGIFGSDQAEYICH